MTLPANSTFLPVLDDLLSPDLRPVLQTPTAEFAGTPGSVTCKLFVIGSNGASTPGACQGYYKRDLREQGCIPEESEQAASVKIQNWWRNRNAGFAPRRNSTGQVVDTRAERAKHSIRHSRTEDHVQYLETEVGRLKSALTQERKLRTLQLEAIRSLWGQVQKMSSSSESGQSLMTQSMPNGLPNSPPKNQPVKTSAMSMSFTGGTLSTLNEDHAGSPASVPAECTASCSKEIQLLRQSLTSEISQLREMITKLTAKDENPDEVGKVKASTSIHGDKSFSDAETSVLSSGESDDKEKDHHPQRPLSLKILGMSQGQAGQSQQPEKKEISGYANEMASKLLEDAVDGKEKESPHPTHSPRKESNF